MSDWGKLVSFEQGCCVACGVRFGLPPGYIEDRRGDKKDFFCPNGHKMSFGENETDRLRRERDILKQRIAQKDDEVAEAKRQAASAKGQLTKLTKRVAHGVCPCCNRTFANLARHMATKHTECAIAHRGTPKKYTPDRAIESGAEEDFNWGDQ